MDVKGSFSDEFKFMKIVSILLLSYLVIPRRLIFSISSKLHGRLPDCSLQHCHVLCCISNLRVHHPSFQVYSKCNSFCHHYISCAWPNWHWGSMFDMEGRQIWFCRLHWSLLWSSFCLCWDRPFNCGKNLNTILVYAKCKLCCIE